MCIKKILRNFPTSIMMIVGISVIVFVALSSSKLLNNIFFMVNKDGLGLYTENHVLVIEDKMNYKNFIKEFEEYKEYITLIVETQLSSNGMVEINHNIEYENVDSIVNIEFSFADDYKDVLYNVTGKDIDYAHNEKIAVISNDLEEYVIEKEGVEYININQENFRVVDVIENKNIEELIYLCNFRPEDVIQDFGDNNKELCIAIHSLDKNVVSEISDKIEMKGYAFYMYEMDFADMSSYEESYVFSIGLFTIIIYIFAFINCVVMSDIWNKKRMKEYAIRRVNGTKSYQLIIHMLSRMFLLSFLGIIIGGISSIIYMKIMKEVIIWKEFMLLDIVYILMIVASAMFISIILPIIRILKLQPINLLNERSGL